MAVREEGRHLVDFGYRLVQDAGVGVPGNRWEELRDLVESPLDSTGEG